MALPQPSTHIRHVRFDILMNRARSLVGVGSPGRARTADLMINSHLIFDFNEYQIISKSIAIY